MCWTNLNTFWSAREMSEPHSKCTKMHFFGIRVWFIVAPIAPFRAPKVVKRLRKKCHLVPKRYWFPAVFQKGFLNQTIKNAGQNRAECIKFWPILSSFLTNFEPVTGRQSTQDRADRFSAVEQPTHRQYLLDIADGSAAPRRKTCRRDPVLTACQWRGSNAWFENGEITQKICKSW